MLKNNISLKNISLFFVLAPFAVWSFFSAVPISGKIIISIAVLAEVFLLLTCDFNISIDKMSVIWFISFIYLIVFSRYFSVVWIAFLGVYGIMVLLISLLRTRLSTIDESVIPKMLIIFSVVSIFFVLLDMFAPKTMESILKLLHAVNNEEALTNSRRIYSGLAGSNNIATFSVLICSTYFLFLHRKNNIVKWIMLFFCFLIVLLGEQRTNYVFFPLSFVLVYYLKSGSKEKVNIFLVCAFVIIFSFILIYAFREQLSSISSFGRITKTINNLIEGEDISNGRMKLYSRAIELWKKSPVFGNGFLSFYHTNEGILRANTLSHAHCIILEMLADVGFVGTCVLMFPIIYSIVKNIKNVKLSGESKYFPYFMGTLTFQIFFILDSLLHVTYFQPNILFIYFSVIVLFNICDFRFKKELEEKKSV